MIAVSVDEGSLREVEAALLAAGQNPKAEMKRVLNQVAGETEKKLYQKVMETYMVKRRAFPKHILKLKKAAQSNLKAVILVQSGPPALRRGFKVKKNGKKKAAQAVVKKDGDMKELVVDGRKAFVTTMHNSGEGAEDHVAVFQRIGKGRIMKQPGSHSRASGKRLEKLRKNDHRAAIKELFGPSASKMSEVTFLEMYGDVGRMLLNEMQKAISQGGKK